MCFPARVKRLFWSLVPSRNDRTVFDLFPSSLLLYFFRNFISFWKESWMSRLQELRGQTADCRDGATSPRPLFFSENDNLGRRPLHWLYNSRHINKNKNEGGNSFHIRSSWSRRRTIYKEYSSWWKSQPTTGVINRPCRCCYRRDRKGKPLCSLLSFFLCVSFVKKHSSRRNNIYLILTATEMAEHETE